MNPNKIRALAAIKFLRKHNIPIKPVAKKPADVFGKVDVGNQVHVPLSLQRELAELGDRHMERAYSERYPVDEYEQLPPTLEGLRDLTTWLHGRKHILGSLDLHAQYRAENETTEAVAPIHWHNMQSGRVQGAIPQAPVGRTKANPPRNSQGLTPAQWLEASLQANRDIRNGVAGAYERRQQLNNDRPKGVPFQHPVARSLPVFPPRKRKKIFWGLF